MASKNMLINTAIVISTIAVIVIFTNVEINLSKNEEKELFPGIIGDSILKNNDTGIYSVRNITVYDDFRGNIVQGYKATYSSSNGTMIIFIAQMSDNITADISLRDMIARTGYNDSASFNETGVDWTVIKLKVENPEVFVIRKDNRSMWHYTFSKLDKVYWIGFSNEDIDYQLDMLVEVYRDIDRIKGSFDDI